MIFLIRKFAFKLKGKTHERLRRKDGQNIKKSSQDLKILEEKSTQMFFQRKSGTIFFEAKTSEPIKLKNVCSFQTVRAINFGCH